MKTAKKIAELIMQCDRWPLTSFIDGPYIVTIICVAHFTGKPTAEQLGALLKESSELTERLQ